MGKDQSMFLFQGEYEIARRLVTDPMSVAHPFVLFPLFGQMLLLITLFQKTQSKLLTYAGIACLGLLLGFISFIGIISLNALIFASTIPFIFTAVYTIWTIRRRTNNSRV
jgi:cobalamin biosynthesis protein CobD/CbiB